MGIYVGITALNRSSNIQIPVVTEVEAPTNLARTITTATSSLAVDEYFYAVTALGTVVLESGLETSDGETVESAEVSANVTATGRRVALTWDEAPGATGYRVYRGTATGDYDGYYDVATNSFTDQGAAFDGETAPPADANAVTGPVRTKLAPGTVYIVDVDNSDVRRELARHSAIGQWKVVAVNDTYRAADGSLDNLPAND